MDIPTANRAWDWTPPQVQPWILGALFLFSMGAFFLSIWPKIRVMRLAVPENRWDHPLQRIQNTLKIAFGQSKLFKDSKPGLMHAMFFWGFLILLLRAAQFFAIGFFPRVEIQFPGSQSLFDFYGLARDAVIFLVVLAAKYGLYRRLVLKPKNLTLSFDGILILVLILFIMLTDVLFEAAWFSRNPDQLSLWSPLGALFSWALMDHLSPAALIATHNAAYWGHVSFILFFITLLPNSKHFHIVASIPNVYFSNPQRTGSGLRRIDFEEEGKESFGVNNILDLSWKSLLDLHTCTECGRCDSVCPALNSGKPLSPKKLTTDLRDYLNAATPRLLETSGPAPGEGPALLGGVIDDETLWACTSCGACEEACPVMIDYVDKIIAMRQGLVMTESRMPKELEQAFKSLEVNSNPWGFGKNTRADWADGLDIKLWDKENPTEYLYFVGCNGSFDHRGKKISTQVTKLLKEAGVDFSILGMEEGCTGDPARRAGNEYLFDLLASTNAETFKAQRIKKVVTHCPHCFNSLKNEYPEFGANLEVIHHSELLAKLIQEGKLKREEKSESTTVYHDSCYLGRHNQEYEAPRDVLSAGVDETARREVENSRENGTCCGAGGGRFLMEENTGTRMSHNRVDELMATQPDTIAVSCPFCVLMIEDALKAKNLHDKVKVKDISEILE